MNLPKLLLQETAQSVPFFNDLVASNKALFTIITSFLNARDRLLVIAGEPGNGKSLLTGGISLMYHQLKNQGYNMPSFLRISYDIIHYKFLSGLAEFIERERYIPVGETLPRIRRMIASFTTDIISYAVNTFDTSIIIWESPMTGDRGEASLEAIRKTVPLQTIVMFSPTLWQDALRVEQRLNTASAQRKAILQIRYHILQSSGAELASREVQMEALEYHWKHFAYVNHGTIVSWETVTNRKFLSALLTRLMREARIFDSDGNQLKLNAFIDASILRFLQVQRNLTDLYDEMRQFDNEQPSNEHRAIVAAHP